MTERRLNLLEAELRLAPFSRLKKLKRLEAYLQEQIAEIAPMAAARINSKGNIHMDMNEAEEIGRALAKEVKAVATTIRGEIAALEMRLVRLEAALELQAGLKYLGPWKDGRTFEPGAFVTCDDALWHANQRTSARPGKFAAWTLALKSH